MSGCRTTFRSARVIQRSAIGVASVIVCIAVQWSPGLAAQSQSPSAQPSPAPAAPRVESSGESVIFTYANRPIATLRARVLGHDPEERARGATRVLDDLVDRDLIGPVASRPFESAMLITVASRNVLALTTLDVDELSGETLQDVTAQTVERLRQALGEAEEARTPGKLIASAGQAAVGLAIGLFLLWAIAWARRRFVDKAVNAAERTITASGLADAHSLRASRLLELQRKLLT